MPARKLRSIEICAGAGGQALGLERAGFEHLALVESDPVCCETLRNIHSWRKQVRQICLKEWRAVGFRYQVDLLSGGVPCPPFSRAGRQLGGNDERDLFPSALRIVYECEPKAVMFENVRGILSERFSEYREETIERPLRDAGYELMGWRVLQARNFGVPQRRPRAVFVAMMEPYASRFEWPSEKDFSEPPTVGQALYKEMRSRGWEGAKAWAEGADGIAPTLAGGSKKHGGPDLGPTQAKAGWAKLGVNGRLVADEPPGSEWNGEPPILTVKMAGIIQGFPSDWPLAGTRTQAYRQVGNAFPPPVAEAVGVKIARALRSRKSNRPARQAAALG